MPSDLDLAVSLPGEADLLSTVIASPADDTAKLVYTDWLDEHDDERGTFLREFVSAAREGQSLPGLDRYQNRYPAGWQEMVGVRLTALIHARELAEHRTAILARAKPAVAIYTVRASERDFLPGETKFGGRPALPQGSEWPRCERAPLEFLAQFDLAELSRTVAGQALPPDGLLSFFMYHNYPWDAYGDGPRCGPRRPADHLHPARGRPLPPGTAQRSDRGPGPTGHAVPPVAH